MTKTPEELRKRSLEEADKDIAAINEEAGPLDEPLEDLLRNELAARYRRYKRLEATNNEQAREIERLRECVKELERKCRQHGIPTFESRGAGPG